MKWRNVVDDGYARPIRYELRAFHVSLNETFLIKNDFCKLSNLESKRLLKPIMNLRHSRQNSFPEYLIPDADLLFINELLDESPGRESYKGLEYIYGEAGPDDVEFTFTNFLSFAYYYVTIRACYGNYSQPDCSNPTLILTQTKEDQYDNEVENIKVEFVDSHFELTWDIPKNSNGPILYFHVKTNGTMESARCITYQEYIRNDRKFIITDLQPDLLSVSMRSVGSDWDLKPAEVKIKSKIQTGQDMWKIHLLLLVLGIVIVIVMMESYQLWQERKTNRSRQVIKLIDKVFVKPNEPDDSYEVTRESVELSNEIGKVDFGRFFKGTLKTANGGIQSVAVKMVNEDATPEESADLLHEASIMKKFDSIHIVQLLGIVTKTQPYLVIMELMANGDLKTFLRKNRPVGGVSTTSNNYTAFWLHHIIPPVSHMAIQIADGMAYMEQKKFVHYNLAARNCMVTADYTVKIGNFDSAQDIHESDYYRLGVNSVIPVRWMPPECLRDGIFSSQSDVFSYGIVLWEIVTYGEQPYKGLSNEQVVKFVTNGGTEEKPIENCPENIFELMQRCWKFDPCERISFIEIIEALIGEAPENFREHSFYYLKD